MPHNRGQLPQARPSRNAGSGCTRVTSPTPRPARVLCTRGIERHERRAADRYAASLRTAGTIWHSAYVPGLHLEVHYGVDLASDAIHVNGLCAALVDLRFGPAVRVLAYERDRGAVDVDLHDAGLVHRVIVEKGCERGAVFKELEADSPPSHPRRSGM